MLLPYALLALLVNDPLPTNAGGVFTKLVASKLNMRDSYHVRLRVESRRPPPSDTALWVYTAEIWRSGDKFRIDLFDADSEPFRPGQPGHKSRDVTCQNCERPGRILMTTIYPGQPAVTAMVGFQTSPGLSPMYTTLNIDWRFLGLCNNPLSLYQDIQMTEGYRQLASNPKLHTSQQVRGGSQCLVASLGPAGQFDVWFDEANRFNPVLHSSRHKDGQVPGARLTTEVAWKSTPGDHLYPSRVAHTFKEGDSLRHEEVLTVLDADFHNPVDPAVFTLAGLGLNNNQQVGFPELKPEDQPRWRDGKVDYSLSARAVIEAARAEAGRNGSVPTPRPAPAAPYPDNGDSKFLVLGIASGVMALASLAVLVYRRRRGA